MKKSNSSMEYTTPVIEVTDENLTVLCTSTGMETEILIEDNPINW